MAEKCHGMEGLLRDLANKVGDEDKEAIMKLLEKAIRPPYVQHAPLMVIQDTIEIPDIGVERESVYSADQESSSGQESDISARAGSTGAVDRLEEDVNRTEQTRAMGFMGKNSDVTWMHAVQEESQGPNGIGRKDSGYDKVGAFTIAESNYHLDDMPLEPPGPVGPFDLPPQDIADNLFNVYLSTVHPSFPIIGRNNFTSQYRQFWGKPHDVSIRRATKWRAILNLIFAIGAKYAHLVQADWRGDERDHLVYFTRARHLSLGADVMFAHPDLQLIQVYGLTGFYLLSTNQVNR
ncbi:MAG: hypothetical protein Q9227_001710 [Pyrenula ochraceoflavens]